MNGKRPRAPFSAKTRPSGSVSWGCQPPLQLLHDVRNQQHGEDAPIHAAIRADAMLEKGDVDGYAVWKRVLKAVGALLFSPKIVFESKN